MTDIGYFSLLLAFVLSAYGVMASILGVRKSRMQWVASAENTVLAVAALLTLASIALVYALVSRDFHVQYVASYSSRTLPLFYAVSAFWAGQAGSLLLWGWLLGIFSAIVVLQNRRQNRALMPYVISVLMTITLFFLALMIYATNPFHRLPVAPQDGMGLNPLLQNPGMIFHPPTLFLGYVGFAIPFAFAMAALFAGQLDDRWIRTTRRWTLFSWLFLGIGNLLGAQWAYVELGWGGYWAWDPVENASFMPWLVGTAYLHSVMIQERRGMLKVWNMVLIIATFLLTLFGTFITRSGILSSVHSFGESSLGPFFLVFLGLVILFAFGLLVARWELLRSEHQLDAFLSRESSFLFNNLILVGITFAVFLGTIFPVLSEAVRGVKVTVGPPFFNQVNVPVGLALLFLTGICPLVGWRRTSARNLKRNFLYPLLATLVGGGILLLLGLRHGYALLSFMFCIFVITTILLEFYWGTRARRNAASVGYLRALFGLVRRNKRRYGGYIVHVGMVLIFVGITGSAFNQEKTVTLKQGESVTVGDYRLIYEGKSDYPTEHKHVVVATLSVHRDGRQISTLTPEKNFHRTHEQPTTEAGIYTTFEGDLYAILAGYDEETASFKILVNPLVVWLWIGGGVLIAGGVVVMWPDRRRRRSVVG